jgi:prolyl-tRNA synthetase
MIYSATFGTEARLVMAVLLGDDSVNEIKLSAHLKCDHLAIATDDQLAKAKLIKGYIGPVDTIAEIQTIFDSSIDLDASYVVGANKKDFHTEGYSPRRDSKTLAVSNIRLSKSGDLTIDGKATVIEKRGIEVGHVFQLGDLYTKKMKVGILDQNGKLVTPLMGCYGIGVTRVVAAAIEQNHDENGIVWPLAIAPYHVYFATIVKSEEYIKIADLIYNELLSAGIEVVYDDRNVGPGNKFKDADLLGLPFRLVLGERDFSSTGELEIISRKTGAIKKVKREEVVSTILNLMK